MHILYAKQFSRDLDKINHAGVRAQLKLTIQQLQEASSLPEIDGVRKIQGYKTYYRLRLGDYRLGIKLTDSGIELIRFLHRKDIYRRFP